IACGSKALRCWLRPTPSVLELLGLVQLKREVRNISMFVLARSLPDVLQLAV
ncbi:hypothetical protein PanWU01x14_013100, partial [Parasponia andersonii]